MLIESACEICDVSLTRPIEKYMHVLDKWNLHYNIQTSKLSNLDIISKKCALFIM